MRRMISEKQLNERYVKIIPAPKSTTLTDEQIGVITQGVFIDGTFLDYTNPIFLPTIDQTLAYSGVLISGTTIIAYRILKETKVIEVQPSSRVYALNSVGYINSKLIPNYPSSSGTFTLKIVDGVLTWVEDV